MTTLGLLQPQPGTPVTLARRKVDVIIGNPPWINYNQTADALRSALETQSKELYGIWAGGRYATHQDVAGLFFTRCADLYLKDGGITGMVMPHSALQAGQYSKWRSGQVAGPARRQRPDGRLQLQDGLGPGAAAAQHLLPGSRIGGLCPAWRRGHSGPPAGSGPWSVGKACAGADDVRRVGAAITDTGVPGDSPYAGYSRQGATIVPRCLFFVHEAENPALVQAGQTVTVNPRRGGQDKPPWKDLDLTAITGQTVESDHLFDVHLGETLVPYATLEPLKALLPLRQGESAIPVDTNGVGGVRLGGLDRRMRDRLADNQRLLGSQ